MLNYQRVVSQLVLPEILAAREHGAPESFGGSVRTVTLVTWPRFVLPGMFQCWMKLDSLENHG